MRTFMTVSTGMLVLALVSVAFGDGGAGAGPTKGDDAGGAGNAVAAAAPSPMDHCKEAVAQAEETMTKGKNTRGQGLMWQDKEMISGGTALYEKGGKALEDAKKLSPECARYVADLEAAKKEANKTPTENLRTKSREGRY